MRCANKEKNQGFCRCTYTSCSRHGMCCECVKYHQANGELPGCFFPPEAEKTYNRSIEYFVSLHQ
ncbi:MAG: DUF6485 family protein [Candidatus Omnitrophica bacterium]|nr:DUF6485 family protein [Candidatus Omnitrophota bacterium]